MIKPKFNAGDIIIDKLSYNMIIIKYWYIVNHDGKIMYKGIKLSNIIRPFNSKEVTGISTPSKSIWGNIFEEDAIFINRDSDVIYYLINDLLSSTDSFIKFINDDKLWYYNTLDIINDDELVHMEPTLILSRK